MVNPTAMPETDGPVNCLSAELGTRSKRNFHRPESNCGIALSSAGKVFIGVGQQTSQMLAPPRLLELIRDPRIIAAVASAITALTNGLSAASQKFVFMLIISSIWRPVFQIGLRTYPKTVTFCVAGDFGAGQGARSEHIHRDL